MRIEKTVSILTGFALLSVFADVVTRESAAEPAMDIAALSAGVQTPHKFGRLVIKPSLKDGTFDSRLADCPFPFYHDGKYRMTYVGWDSVGYRTGIASSHDLINWTKDGLLLDRGPAGSPTEFNAAMTCIVRNNDLFSSGTLKKFNNRFIGTYHAYPGKGYESGPASIGICTSTDLSNWNVEEPVLKPDPACAWEAGGLYKSWLLEHDGMWYMFYNAKDKTDGDWKEQTGVATSTDLKTWTRYKDNPVIRNGASGSFDEKFASDPCVFRYRDVWVMFYFGLSMDGHAREGVAFSRDLLSWEKSSSVLLDVGKPGSIDSVHAHKPGMIAKDGVLYHFYCAVAPAGKGDAGAVGVTESRGITFAAGIPVHSTTEYVSDVPERIIHERQEWGLLGLNVAAHHHEKAPTSIRMGGGAFPKGIGTHASSDLLISLDASCRRFEAEVGIQDGQRTGSAVFEVRVDGKPVFQSGVVREGMSPLPVRVDVSGGRLLELRVRDGGNGIAEDLANWGNALLVRDASVSASAAAASLTEDVDVAPFAVIIGSDPRRMDGVHNGRFDSFPKYELNPDWPLAADEQGCTTTEPMGGEVSVGLRWLERRRVRRLELRFPADAVFPDAGKVRVQRWVFEKSGGSPGGSRWQGHWKDMPGSIGSERGRYHFTPDWKNDRKSRNEGVLKVRWILPADKALPVAGMSAWTDTLWTTNSVTVSALRPLKTPAELSVYNGVIQAGSQVHHKVAWEGRSALPLIVRHSERMPWRSDGTILRFSLPDGGFGVAVNDLLVSGSIHVAEYGITISLGSSAQDFAEPATGTSILEDVRKRPDQTFAQALAALERPEAHLGPTMLSLACDNRKYIVERNGNIAFETSAAVYNSIDQQAKDKYSCLFEPRLGSGTGGETTRSLEEGWLPIPTITTRRDGITFRQRVFVAPAGGQQSTSSVLFSNSKAIAVCEFILENSTTAPLPVQVLLPCFQEVAPGPTWTASVGTTPAPARRDGNLWLYEKDNVIMCAVAPTATTPLQTQTRDGIIAITGTLNADARAGFTVLIPGWESTAEELAQLPASSALFEATRSHWERALSEGARIRLPDTFAENLIRASQVHCMIASRNRDSRLVAPWIGSALYGPLESESQSIIRGMEALGHFEFARRAHDYFITRYNDEGFITPTYTVVGTGWHLWSLGEYVRLSNDTAWMKANAGEVLRVCRWITAQLAKTTAVEGGGGRPDPLRGLMPPGALADWESFASWYSLNGWFYAGLNSAAQALQEVGVPEAANILTTTRAFGDAVRASFRQTRSLAPVVPLRNGTWAPYYPAHPECPMPVEDLHADEDGGRSWCYNVELGAHHLIPQGVIDSHGPEADSMVNHMEDIQFLRDGWQCYPASRSTLDPFNLGGFAKVQPFYARIADIHAMRDDIKPFLRTWINSAASLVNREDLSLWEHFFNGAWNKTHETGWFLNQASLLFAVERGEQLWLAPFVSDQWLKDGMAVEARGIPTSFGRTGFRLVSHAAQDSIEAEVDFPDRKAPSAVFLRVRHPDGKAVRAVEIDGMTAKGWSAADQTLRLVPHAAASKVTLRY